MSIASVEVPSKFIARFFLNASFVVVSIFLFCLAFFSENLGLTLWLFSLFCLFIVLKYNDRSFTNPLAIFTLFFYPYSTWFVYYSALDGGVNIQVLNESVLLSYFGLLVFYLVGCLFSLDKAPTAEEVDASLINSKAELSVKLLILMSSSIVLLAVFEAAMSGASSKREVIESARSLGSVADFSAMMLTCGALLLFNSRVRIEFSDAIRNGFFLLASAALTAGFLLMGERDYIFRLAFCLVVLSFSRFPIANFFVLALILICLVLLLPVTQAAKGLLLPGADFELTYDLKLIFYGEFISASRNIYMLIENGVEHAYSFFWSDIARAFVPFGANYGFESTGSWYNNTYRVENGFSGTAGWGFSLIAQGYLIDGYVGVALVMGIVSSVLHYFYARRGLSSLWMIFYVMTLSTAIYCIRSDLANFLSQTFKVGGLCIVVYWFSSFILRKKSSSEGVSDARS
ncbi:O-antigen polysaccharide polymerase Wzy [Phytopseudomonas daroniae]|uniref:O-antigen polysaccharide polymerase Wzy n=1 Tax=Phytopseudomonas daroniae TaxID=2487519 RepID=UPI00103852BD|nr:oligosaccharide repeat unit polymerase [Pseudomonas daroniae]TBU74535.1 hypothetical protein DNK10_14155 [Pseudomonas daroniae]